MFTLDGIVGQFVSCVLFDSRVIDFYLPQNAVPKIFATSRKHFYRQIKVVMYSLIATTAH